MHVMGIEEPSPTIMDEKLEGEQDDNKFKLEDICEDAHESNIQSVPWFLSMNCSWRRRRRTDPSLVSKTRAERPMGPGLQSCKVRSEDHLAYMA